MNLLKKVSIGVGAILTTAVGTMILLNGSSITANDEVTMEAFNNLKTEVETLKEELTTYKEENVGLRAIVNENTNEISKTKTDLTANIDFNSTRISKIETWQIKAYELMWNCKQSQQMCWADIEKFRKTQ